MRENRRDKGSHKFLRPAVQKIVSWFLIMAMLVTLPQGMSLGGMKAQAAGTQTNLTLHFQNEGGWTTPAIQWWQYGDVTPSHSDGSDVTLQEISGWGGAQGALLKEDDDNFYSISLKGTIGGFNFLDMKEYETGKHNSVSAYDEAAMPQYHGETPQDLYYLYVDTDNDGTKDAMKWFLDAEGQTPLEPPADAITSTDLTVHFKNERNWETVYGMFGAGGSWTAITDYEYCKNSTYGGIINANASNEGWYSYRVTKNDALAVNGNFNCGDWGDLKQTANYSIDITAETMEVWITFKDVTKTEGDDAKAINVSTEAPEGWVAGAGVTKPVNPADLSEVESPVINEDGSVTFNYEISAEKLGDEKLCLMGNLTDWDNGKEMTDEDGDGVYSITIPEVKPGKYQYKFKYGGNWVTDPLNSRPLEGGNSVLVVEGFLINCENPAGAGNFAVSVDLPEGTAVDKSSIQWYVTDEEGQAVDGITVTGNPEDLTKAVLTTTKDAQTGYIMLGANYKEDGTDKSAELKLYYTKKAYLYEYVYKEGSAWTGKSDIYTWYNSKAGNTGAKFRAVNGRNTAYITLDDTTKSFGYIVRLPGEWGASEAEDREFKDRTLTVQMADRYTKVKGGEGIEVPYMLPSAKTSYQEGILFAWRDDDRFYNNTMDELADKTVQVVITDQDGNTVTKNMTYNAQDELFTYHFNAEEGIKNSTYSFYFMVDGTRVEDQYWNGTIEYQKPELDIKAALSTKTANYDENPVVTFTIQDKATGKDVAVNAITAPTYEGWSLNGAASSAENAQTIAFSPTTKEGVLYLDRSMKAGTYKIPFTITDAWGNKTVTEVELAVTDRDSTDASWDESRIYFLLTDRFCNGDTSNDYDCATDKIEAYHGGDFKGLTSKLDYLKDLGINTIWISPIVDNIEDITNETLHQQAYHGYWAKDFTTIDEHLGDTKDLDNLIDEADKRGIKIMVDIVVNHAGYNTNDQENFAGMLRTEEDEVEGDVILGELDNMPDFKTEVPEVRQKLIAWQTAWANHTTSAGNRIAYFRVDTVKHVDHETWQELKTSLAKTNPAFKMIGEYFGAGVSNTGDYLGNGQMDALLDFEFKSTARSFVDGSIDAVEQSLEARNEKLSGGITMGQFLSSHDEDGFLYSVDNDTAKMKLAAALQMTAKGVPIIYYGEEINLTGPNAFGDQGNNRYEMQFTNLSGEQQAMLGHYKKLLAARAKYSDVFAAGTRTKVAGSDADQYLIFKRSTDSENVYVGLNTSSEAKTVTFNVAEKENLVDVYSGKAIAVSDGKVTVTIPANADGGTVIIAKEKKEEELEPQPEPQPDKEVAVTSVKLNKTKVSINKGKSYTLKATVAPANATNKKVTFSSSKPKVASVNSKGKITAKKAGTTVITVKTANGKKATCKVTVKVPSTKLFLTGKVNVVKGKTKTLYATVLPSDSTDKITWKSSNKKVVTVDKNGKIKGIKAGTATITAKSTSGKKATCKVTVVKKAKKATSVKLNKKTLSLNKGKYYQLKATITKNSTDTLRWSSSNKKVATVDKNGVVIAKKKGTTKITVKTASGKKATCTVKVKIPATKVKLNKTSVTLKKGKTLQLKATKTPSNSTDKVTWKSSNKKVVTVTAKGKVKALKKGKAAITVKTTSGKKATCKITVK